MKKTLLVLILMAAGGAVFGQSFTVQNVSGRVERETGGGWEAVKAGDTLTGETVIRTGIGAHLTLVSGGRTFSVRAVQAGRLASLACFALTLPLLFTAADNKIYDLFLRALPPLTEHEQVYVLTLDDDSIGYAGGFPFRREVMADVVVLLKEMGVRSITFDLNYLDESPLRLDREYAGEVFSRYLDEGFGRINEAAVQLIDGFT
jgi:hypothetical protein